MVAGRRAWSRDLLLILILAALPVLAYAPAWSEDILLAPGEGAALHLPLRVEAWRALDRGEVPTWNPSAFAGSPLLATFRPGALHPLMLVLTPLAPFTSFQLLVLVSLAFSGPLVFVFVRRLGGEPVGALVAGAGFALGPGLVGRLEDTALLVAAPAIVLVLLATETLLSDRRSAAVAGLALGTALVLLAGSPEAVAVTGLLVAARMAWAAATIASPRARFGGVIGAVVLGAALSGPQLVPALLAWPAAGFPGDGLGPVDGDGLSGLTGFLAPLVTHTPAPLFALAALPLLSSHRRLRGLAMAALGLGVAAVGIRSTPLGGALFVAFDLVLALLGGLALSAQWTLRQDPQGRRLRTLTVITALLALGGVSVFTSVAGPLPQGLAPPVGLLALAFIAFAFGSSSPRTVVAHLFLVPLLGSFLLQPWGRGAWQGAPTSEALREGTPTRRAIDRVMGPRRHERTLSLAESWPRARARDLAWANLGTFSGRRNVEGYDPLVPESRLLSLGGMRADGTLGRPFLESDPGRLELLGVRWVQVPTRSLVARADDDALGDALDVVVEPPRPKQFALPFTHATQVRFASFLVDATHVAQGEVVAECFVRLATGREIRLPIRAGVHTAEWAWERPDVREAVRHRRARILKSFPVREGFDGHQYLGVLGLRGRYAVVGLRFQAVPGAPPLWLLRLGLRDRRGGKDTGVGLASGFLSDSVRLREAAGTPLVTLFEVRHGVGPAWVVESLRRLPDATRVRDLLRSPTRLGVDSRREALAVEGDVEGVALPPQSRSSGAVLARAAGGRVVLRAAGPGLLVVGEGWDPGWTVRVDGREERVLKVNGDRLGVVLPDGIHRVVFVHRARGFSQGVLLSLLGILGLGVWLWWGAPGGHPRSEV